MKSELINLVFEYDKNRNTPDSEECWNKLLEFLKSNKKCTESNLELDIQIKDLVKQFHKLSKDIDDARGKLQNFNVNVRPIIPSVMVKPEEHTLELKLSASVKKLDIFLHTNGIILIRTLLKELEIKTAESNKK